MDQRRRPNRGVQGKMGGTALFTRFVVLIPHRDTEKTLGEYRRRLFAGGLAGAWSFPSVVPLGILSRPLSAEELRELAGALRGASLEGGRGGWFRTGAAGTEPLPRALFPGKAGASRGEGAALHGPLLDFAVPAPPGGTAPEKFLHRFPRPLLVSALVWGEEVPLPPFPPLAFRAAALANLILRLLDSGDRDFSFEWKIGRPFWLSSVKSTGPANT